MADDGDDDREVPFDPSVQLLCDEHVPYPIYRALTDAGFAVTHVRETMAGAEDPDVLAHCVATDTVLLTNDDDFLADSSETAAILFLDDQGASPQAVVAAIANIDATVGLEELTGRVEHVPDGWLW